MKTYEPKLKAQVIADRTLNGTSLNKLAAKYDIPKGTVQRWVTEKPVSPIPIPEKEDLGRLVYDYLVAGLKALIAQAGAMADPEWFKANAASAHLIHGTLADKLVIVFGGIERGAGDGGTDADGGGDREGEAVAVGPG